MRLEEEEHRRMHSRGEMVKFAILVIVFLLTVLTVSALRPFIFEQIVPAMLGWNESQGPLDTAPAGPVQASATPVTPTVEATATVTTAAQEATPVPNTPAPSPTPLSYQVQPGDTLAEISARFGVSIQAIVQANGIANPDRIQPGDVIVIPGE